jgi:hypothetical protein
MRVTSSLSGPVLPGTIAGAIYFAIAVATGTSVAASLIAGVCVAVFAIFVGFTFRVLYLRWAASHAKR